MSIKINKTFGKHDKIGWWAVFAILPSIAIARSNDFIKEVPVYGIAVRWLFWELEINNNKSY